MSTNGVRPRSCPPPAITAGKGNPDLGDLLDRPLCGFLAVKDATIQTLRIQVAPLPTFAEGMNSAFPPLQSKCEISSE